MRIHALRLLALTLLGGCATPQDAALWLDAHSPENSDGTPTETYDATAEPSLDGDADLAPDASPGADATPADATPADATPADATPAFDAAPDSDADAAPNDDAGPAFDAAPDPDSEPAPDHGPCAVRGTPGTCLHIDDCAGTATPGFCPGPAAIQCCTDQPPPDPDPGPGPDPALDCDPADHPQPNADLHPPPGLDNCPAGMAAIEAFCIDRWEATLLEITPEGTERPWSPYHNPGNSTVRAIATPGAIPQGYIDAHRAQRACMASGKRLCTDAEWLRACQFTDARTYPYGPARRPGLCNDARARHPAIELFPDAPNPFALIQHPCINQLPESLAPTGAHPECITPEGIFDLMGNLHEWTADPAGTFRGGFYVDTIVNGNGCLYRTTAHDRSHWDYSTGFRCCADR